MDSAMNNVPAKIMDNGDVVVDGYVVCDIEYSKEQPVFLDWNGKMYVLTKHIVECAEPVYCGTDGRGYHRFFGKPKFPWDLSDVYKDTYKKMQALNIQEFEGKVNAFAALVQYAGFTVEEIVNEGYVVDPDCKVPLRAIMFGLNIDSFIRCYQMAKAESRHLNDDEKQTNLAISCLENGIHPLLDGNEVVDVAKSFGISQAELNSKGYTGLNLDMLFNRAEGRR